VDLNQQIDNHIMAIIAVSNLAALLFQQGRRREAATLCQETIARYADARGRPIPPAGVAYILLATMHYEANELEQTHDTLLKGLELNEHMALLTVTLMGKTLLAQLQQAMGETQAALATIRETCQAITEENAWRRSALCAKAVEVDLQLKQGDVAAVAGWADTMHLSPTDVLSYPQESLHLVYVRLLLAQNRPDKAQTLLARLERVIREEGRYGNLITVHALQALTQQAIGQEEQALAYLKEALLLAAPQDYYRSLLDEGSPLASLLFKVRNRLGETVDAAFVDNLVAAFQTELEYLHHLPPTPQPLIEPLTERELEVLQLIVAGLSNREIADELYVAMGTVKKHITNIYGKLGVQRRAQAIGRARELDLL
jgi:LuxR family maltose regulon positive regulatory protein